ncbi:EF-hand domain-containing protein [Streptomyces sp. NPDC004284]|uniref:EF-hand domain-containing protein n=1 Tax=Streptomyces sp. NPDC004284 TaxID=3364695 RepID=UPI0036B700DA
MRNAFVADPDLHARGFKPLAEAQFAICDRDGDGRIQANEFVGFHKAYGASLTDALLSFEKLDRNNDGWLSLDGLLMAHFEYCTSEDPDAPGNRLYGNIWQDDIWQGSKVVL